MSTRSGAVTPSRNGSTIPPDSPLWYGAYDWDQASRDVSSASPPDDPPTGNTAGTAGIAKDGDGAVETVTVRVGPSVPQIAGSAAASASAALVASQLGVAGTIIGAAIFSIVSTICAAYYTSFVTSAHRRVRRFGETAHGASAHAASAHAASAHTSTSLAAASAVPGKDPAAGADVPERSRRGRWGLAALAAFVLAVAGITALELGLGHAVSGTDKPGTSVGRVINPNPAPATPTVHAPSVRPTDRETGTPTTGAATTSTPSAGPTSGATGSPGGPSPAPTPAPTGASVASTNAPTNAPASLSAPVATPRSN